MLLRELYDEFYLNLQVSNLAATSISNYEWRLKRFVGEFGDLPAKKLRKPHVQRFILKLRNGGELSGSSVNAIVQAVKAFLKWLYEEGHITKELDGCISRKNPDDTTKDIPTTVNMFKQMVKHAYTKRDQLLIIVVMETGARRGELASMRISNIDLDKLTARVRGKVGRRTVTFSKRCADMIREYIDCYRPQTSHDYLFCCTKGEPKPIKPGAIYKQFKTIAARIPEDYVDGPDWPHSFRHLVANLYNDYGDLYLSNQKLGHKDLTTTMGYVQKSLKKVQDNDGDISVLGVLDDD